MKKLNQINLNSLRVAESAARNGNFVLAAEEQLITASAVSQRIKTLEAQLEFQIFDRRNNSVQITPEGELFRLFAVSSG
jgi:LysR family glycine cleavage system transcriptional activator